MSYLPLSASLEYPCDVSTGIIYLLILSVLAVIRRQFLTSKDGPRAERVEALMIVKQSLNYQLYKVKYIS